MREIQLHIPNENELEYRRFLIADEKTMTYNLGYGDKGGSTYHRSLEQIKSWYTRWNKDHNYFYAYIQYDQDFVGEASIHYDNEENKHIVGIILEAKYRGKGYSLEALRLLVNHGFNEMGIDILYDNFPEDRQDAQRLFSKLGFKRINHEWVALRKEDYKKAIF